MVYYIFYGLLCIGYGLLYRLWFIIYIGYGLCNRYENKRFAFAIILQKIGLCEN